MSEIIDSIFSLTETSKSDKVESSPKINKQTIVQGALAAENMMEQSIKDMIRGGKKRGVRVSFNEKFIKDLHKKLLFYAPGWAGEYRIVDDKVLISDYRPVGTSDLPRLMYKYGQWLERETNVIRDMEIDDNGDDEQQEHDLKQALYIACAAHFGLSHLLHPFNDGNGRMARLIVNGILMLGTKELRIYGQAVPPVPKLREYIDEKELEEKIKMGKVIKMEPYLKAIRDVNETFDLTPLEVFIASRWAINIGLLLGQIKERVGEGRTAGDKKLIQRLDWRFSVLEKYVSDKVTGVLPPDPIPDYFALEHIKV